MLYAPSLLQMYLILGPLRDLVKIFASWSFELTKLVATHHDAIFSLMKWQLTSMCLVLSWKTGLDVICKAAWLSQMSFICSSFPNLNSWRRCFNQCFKNPTGRTVDRWPFRFGPTQWIVFWSNRYWTSQTAGWTGKLVKPAKFFFFCSTNTCYY